MGKNGEKVGGQRGCIKEEADLLAFCFSSYLFISTGKVKHRL